MIKTGYFYSKLVLFVEKPNLNQDFKRKITKVILRNDNNTL